MVGLVGTLFGAILEVLVGREIVCLTVTGTFLLPLGFLGRFVVWVLSILERIWARFGSFLGGTSLGFWGDQNCIMVEFCYNFADCFRAGNDLWFIISNWACSGASGVCRFR